MLSEVAVFQIVAKDETHWKSTQICSENDCQKRNDLHPGFHWLAEVPSVNTRATAGFVSENEYVSKPQAAGW